VELFGLDGSSTGRLKLDNGFKNDFERGKADAFTVRGRDVRDFKKLHIGHDNGGARSAASAAAAAFLSSCLADG